MAQITPITSEALQEAIRRLLPSQVGFGEDLQASNVIMPVIDLTPTAEGSILPENLQTALAFGSQTAFKVNGGTSTIINTTGFWRVIGTIAGGSTSSVAVEASFSLTDGFSSKIVYGLDAQQNTAADPYIGVAFDFVVFLKSGDSLTATSVANANVFGSYRQIADVNGNLVNPSGFVAQ